MAETVYRYCPPLAKVREWIDEASLAIEEEGAGSGFHHFVVSKRKKVQPTDDRVLAGS